MDDQPRILHLISRLDGYGGGRMLRHLAASQAAAGSRVTIAALSASESPVRELQAAGVDVQPLRSRGPVDFVAMGRLARLDSRSSADVLHAWDVASLMLGWLTRPRGRQRLAATFDQTQAQIPWSGQLVRTLGKRIAAFAAADEQTRLWLLESGAAADRVQVLAPGVPPAPPSRLAREELLDRLGLPHEARLVATAGPLLRDKQIDEAIWTYELVRVLHPDARLLVLGDGPDRERLERFALSVSEPDCVRFLGFRDDVADLLAHVDVFWQLDAPRSTQLAVLEAMAAGVPVVAGEAPAHRAAIESEVTGFLAAVGARAEVTRITDQLLSDPQLAKQIGAAASKIVADRWPLNRALAAYDRFYARLTEAAENEA